MEPLAEAGRRGGALLLIEDEELHDGFGDLPERLLVVEHHADELPQLGVRLGALHGRQLGVYLCLHELQPSADGLDLLRLGEAERGPGSVAERHGVVWGYKLRWDLRGRAYRSMSPGFIALGMRTSSFHPVL